MFLHMFNEEERLAFLQLAYQLAIADGHEAEEEIGLLGECAREMGMEEMPEMDVTRDIDTLLAIFSEAEIRRAVMLELLRLAHADAIYGEFEQFTLDHVAEKFEMDHTFMLLASEWARMAIALERQGLLLLDLPIVS